MKNRGFTLYKNMIQQFYGSLDKIADIYESRKIVLFGTSNISEMAISYLQEKGLYIDAIIDNDRKKQGEIIYGVKIHKPEEYVNSQTEPYVILVASTFEKIMIKQLEDLGCVLGDTIYRIVDYEQIMNDFSHVDRQGYRELTQDELKQGELEILIKLKEVCQAHGLRYYLSSGTMLGAVRHKGYIPWDDDIDVFMPIDDMLKMDKILEEDERYKLISNFTSYNYYGCGMSLMIDTDTIMDFNRFPLQMTIGLSIDIFPLYGMPEDEEQREEYILKVKELESNCLNSVKDDEEHHNAVKQLNEYLLSFPYEEAKIIGNVMMPAFRRDIFKKKMFGAGSEVEFEQETFMAPEDYNGYLHQAFENPMKLPPVERRKTPHHYFHVYYKNR